MLTQDDLSALHFPLLDYNGYDYVNADDMGFLIFSFCKPDTYMEGIYIELVLNTLNEILAGEDIHKPLQD